QSALNARRDRARPRWLGGLIGAGALLAAAGWQQPPSAHAADNGKVACEVKENGKAASGTLSLLQGDKEVASAPCGKPVSVAAGDYDAVLSLDGALDGPQQKKAIKVAAGQTASANADFATGLLEVRIRMQGRDTAGMAIIRKDGKQVGTLGSGVAAHLSTGSYQVVAKYRTQQKVFDAVAIEQGKPTVLEASFE
ncbi:MAG TPA: hypothetical protein VK509_06545, partial [Polyangiales bacterium]|nr:hypothetical protein [Polyangiales bacterium]